MPLTYDSILQRVAERTVDNRQQLKKSIEQRRTGFVDLYGVEYTRQGDSGKPAQFYISISPDLVYYEQFKFKLWIQPFVSTVSGGTESAAVTVNNTSLSVNNDAISPNPHKHTTNSHTHNIISGLSFTSTTATDFTVSIAGVDVTPYLKAQHGGSWITGEGLYPSNTLEDEDDFYDILAVASVKSAEGNLTDVEALLRPEFKLIEISSDAPFQVSLINYLKYSHLNR